ncbi:unnamed protein product, partial [Urochloa humidicola]
DHLWAAAYSWSPYFFEKHWQAMDEARPDAMDYIRGSHTKIWTRSQFLTHCKVDYVTNNLVESFNNWIKSWKALNLDDFVDKVRGLLMDKWYARRTAARKMRGLILPHIMKKLKEDSFNLDMDVFSSSDDVAEVCVKGSNGFRCVVNLHERTCSCRKFQVSGIPCLHAIAFITKMGQPLENYVDSYYSAEKFRSAYENLIPALTDKVQWQPSNHDFFMHPPLLKSTAGRRKNQRFKGCTETTSSTTRKKGQHRCDVCKGYGHRWTTCKEGNPDDKAALQAERGAAKKKKKKAVEASTEDSLVLAISGPTPMYFPPSQGCSTKSSEKTEKSRCGSSQPDALSVEYPLLNSSETAPPPPSQPTGKRKRDEKAAAVKGKIKKTKGAATKKTKGAATTKKKLSLLPVTPQSPAMCTRSKTPESPAMSTRSKRKILD